MKKFALAAVAAAALMGGVANAYTVGTYSNGFVVPNVIFENAGQTTAVGIINRTNSVVPVFWVFHDQDSGHVTDGCFPLTQNQYKGLGWGMPNDGGAFDMSGAGLAGQRGYLLFAAGNVTNGTVANACITSDRTLNAAAQLSANAFQIDTSANDVAVIPVIDGPLTLAANSDLSTLHAQSLTAIAGAAQVPATTTITARYAKDLPGVTTRVAVWSTGDHSGTHTVNVYNDKQDRRSTNFVLEKAELDWYDPATLVGVPASYTDGFIEWRPSVAPANAASAGNGDAPLASGGSVLVYSTINLPAYGAVQTLLGAHQ